MVKKPPPKKKPSRKPSVKTPRIEFRHSWVYDQENRLRFTDPLYPSADKIRDYADEVSKAWSSKSRSTLNSIARLSGLPWREQDMVCYLVGRGLPMSDPLTMPIYENDTSLFVDRLCYALIERMLMHPANLKARRGFWEEMFRSMSEDGVKVSYMVPVNAIYREIHPKSGDAGGSLVTTNLDYRRAWEIVNELGHGMIIEKFRRGVWD